MPLTWQWENASRAYGNYGNANQWTVNAGMDSLARESAQNSNDARLGGAPAELVYTFIRLTGAKRAEFEAALDWPHLEEHLDAMADSANAAVTAGQIKAGLEAVRSTDDLVLLQVADYGCRGLTGPEFNDGPEDEYGNFIKLCRLDLFSSKDEAAGGSFGLGKAVYWRFSRLQTVVFNSTLQDSDAVGGEYRNRLFGVNAGLIHERDGQRYQGRGYFGRLDGDDVSSIWAEDSDVERMHLRRDDTRPGTTALLLGFYDPDEPDGGASSAEALIEVAEKLRAGVESNFWPLLTRGGLKVSLRVIDNGKTVHTADADPSGTYHELTRALRKFDSGDIAENLDDDPEAVIVRTVPITISARREDGKKHESFVHEAQLVVTKADIETPDSLENRVCLFRKPEMIVETIDHSFEDTKYHAFLVAGAAIRPHSPTAEDLLADDFLRFAEPPAHDRWIPGNGRVQASQANLTARYVVPWRVNLNAIREKVVGELRKLFNTQPPSDGKAPESVLANLTFLKGERGNGGSSDGPIPRKPRIELTDWEVKDGQWYVTAEITARNRPEGWLLDPQLRFVGLDGTGVPVEWDNLWRVSGTDATIDEERRVVLRHRERGRKVTAVISGISVGENLPIPAEEAAVDIVFKQVDPAPVKTTDEEAPV